MFKKRKVVMLPTNERSQIWIGTPALGLRHDQPGSAPFIKYFHLYFLSDKEEIKEGDWFLSNLNEILKCTKREDKFIWYEKLTVPGVSKVAQPFSIHINLKPKKIIATTDTSLTEKIEMLGTGSTYVFNLPQPSQSFIEKFVEEYNKGNVITEVMVEYEFGGIEESYFDGNNEKLPLRLKVNSKDNTITIRKKKDSLNRVELDPILELIREIATDDLDRVSGGIKNKAIERLKWIEENL